MLNYQPQEKIEMEVIESQRASKFAFSVPAKVGMGGRTEESTINTNMLGWIVAAIQLAGQRDKRNDYTKEVTQTKANLIPQTQGAARGQRKSPRDTLRQIQRHQTPTQQSRLTCDLPEVSGRIEANRARSHSCHKKA